MAPSGKSRGFLHQGVSYLDYKQIDMDRVLTAFLARLRNNGWPSRLARTSELSPDTIVDTFLEHPELFEGFDRDVTRRWVETHLVDMVSRGKPTQAMAGLRPLHGYTYRFRNARRSRPYGADEQLYELIRHAPQGRGERVLGYLREFFFTGIDRRTEQRRLTDEIDVETHALINLYVAVKGLITDQADKDKARASHPPLCPEASDLIAEDVVRLLAHRAHIPRSAMVDYLKILFAFHLALYHLRIIKELPKLVEGRTERWSHGIFLDATGDPRSAPARLAERSAQVWFARIPEFLKATYTVAKLDEFAQHLVGRYKLREPKGGFFKVRELLPLLGPRYRADRTAFGNARLASVLGSSHPSDERLDSEISQILQLGLDEFTTYVEVATALRVGFHHKYLTDCLDSLLLKNRPGAMIAQPHRGKRRFVLDSRLLEVLLQISLVRQGESGVYQTAPLRVDEFLEVLRKRYGLYLDRLPEGDGFAGASILDQAVLRANRAAFVARLREIGYYSELSDAYLTQTITPRYVITPDRTA
ncbi:methylation-associated defense system protein MAD7 [uncultured Thermomonospora sp.]|uniref:methylation-associated defense system protein MAD7 n=1 Tax=uncultured Thermomonospora sp. TaxID=671175 RepID=UPI00259B2C74|nr:hypothetical protein [uncultured Thermomonospora sp.]